MKFWLLTWRLNQVRKLAMLEDYFEEEEEEEEQQQQPASGEVATTNTGQRNQPKCSAVRILLAAKEGHSASDVTWACTWCLVSWNITQKSICNTVIPRLTKLIRSGITFISRNLR